MHGITHASTVRGRRRIPLHRMSPGEGEDLSMGSEMNRRDLVKRSAALGLVAVPSAGLLSACASSGGGSSSDNSSTEPTATSADNPFGVDASKPLDVLIFKGGFGNDYAKRFEGLYSKKYPNAKVSHNATQN